MQPSDILVSSTFTNIQNNIYEKFHQCHHMNNILSLLFRIDRGKNKIDRHSCQLLRLKFWLNIFEHK
ncbi:hypothetical protein T05_4262 [Trichinella murrelli]|uniref:Uncharacterized protein n=1 Tax=Trichinella murrelli TaxID=144512 RepID=A0A0V0UIB2_9BILA|nr:hypothetical protein T05_4262 [Trichinella murrelli]